MLSSNSFSLQSVSVSELPDQINNNNNNSEKMFTVTNSRERRLLGGLLVSLLGKFIRNVLLTSCGAFQTNGAYSITAHIITNNFI